MILVSISSYLKEMGLRDDLINQSEAQLTENLAAYFRNEMVKTKSREVEDECLHP